MITQLISTLDEVVPYTVNYFENIALRNNALVTDVFPQFNTAIGQINAELSVMNGYVTSTSTAASNALAYSNNAAASATQAQTAANLATAVVIPTTATYSYTQQDWRQSMISKAEFNAVAAERRANRAGSGFDEFGQHYGVGATYDNINEGMWVEANVPNRIDLGMENFTGGGISKTLHPLANINGIVHRIEKLNTSFLGYSYLTLPPAPTVLPSTATLTAEQTASGVIKHADPSNSGLIVNGKFDTDTSGWTLGTGIAYAAGSSNVAFTSAPHGSDLLTSSCIFKAGKKYIVEFNISGWSAGLLTSYYNVSSGTNAVTFANINISTNGRFLFEFTPSTDGTGIKFQASGTSTYSIDNIAVFPADAISRSDLVFLESWHEDISEKGVVYRYGNVQFKGASESAFGTQVTPSAGTPVFAGYGTYSLFSDTWQADEALIGNCYRWDPLYMTDAQRKAFVADPENSCYLDGDKVIQVRYRIRVVMGWGDSWLNLGVGLDSISIGFNTTFYLGVKGKRVASSDSYIAGTNTAYNPPGGSSIVDKELGLWKAYLDTAYEGKCFAMPIALVHRRNTGMMHPVYNPNGTKLASDSLPWHSTTVSFTSIADCFTDSKLLTASGYIGTTTGRADGIFYDQVHEGDITDLRVNSRGMNDYQRTSDKWMSKLQDGTYRGTEGEWVTERAIQSSTDTATTSVFLPLASSKLSIGDVVYMYSEFDATSRRGVVTTTSSTFFSYVSSTQFNRQLNSYVIIGIKSTRTKSNTLTHTDIIGSPTNYPTAWKQSGVSGVPLIVAEDGTSLLPTGTTGSDGLAVFKLSRDANATPLQVLKSTDSGATWTALTVTTHYTFNLTDNSITFTAGNIPLVAHLIRVTYQTHTNMTVAAVNSEVLAIGDCYSTNSYHPTEFALLSTSLSGKVMTNGYTNPTTLNNGAISSYKLTPLNKLDNGSAYLPIHTNYSLAGATNYAYAVKVFYYLTRSNGKAYLQLVFKEMKYGSYAAPTVVTAASAAYTQNMTYKINIAGCALDGKVIQWTATTATSAIDWSLYDVSPTGVIYLLSSGAVYANARLYDGDSWGDNSKFEITDNVSVITDTNGQSCLYGQKRVELPFFIGNAE